jgi:hypothetical protein
MQATPATMVNHTAWLGLLGAVATISVQPYFSEVNKYFRDHQLQPITVGDLLADARRGLEIRQHRLVPAETRLPLSAPVALDILTVADTLRDNLTWSPSTLPLLERFRAFLAVCVNYTFCCFAKPASAASQVTSQLINHHNKYYCLYASPKGDNAVTPATSSC